MAESWWDRRIESVTKEVEIAEAVVAALRPVAERYPDTVAGVKLSRAEALVAEYQADLVDLMADALADGYQPAA